MSLPRAIISELKLRGERLAAAESCTGGMIADLIVSESGASEVFLGSLVCYDSSVKKSVLKVPEDILKNSGAVSRECALSMAQNALKLFNADYALSATGYAEKSDRPDVEDGTIYVAFASKKFSVCEKLVLKKSRNENRLFAAKFALSLLAKNL
ncbi:MAG: CinA family protein [Opitutales bacterium]|nr:CinA family protein [Opitutales bacterium]